jgi:hypothetical protein
MGFTITIDGSQLDAITRNLSQDDLRQALEDAGQVIINSTKIGYQRQIDPEGNRWPNNPAWYAEMKGTTSVLTGPSSATIRGGRYAGRYTFQDVNVNRMQNLLSTYVNTILKFVQVYYQEGSLATGEGDRSQLTQQGGEGTIILTSTTGGPSLELNVTVQPRVHLGVAEDYARMGTKTDSEHVAEVFGVLIDKHLG